MKAMRLGDEKIVLEMTLDEACVVMDVLYEDTSGARAAFDIADLIESLLQPEEAHD